MVIDHHLIISAELLATGATIHECANRVAAYKGTIWLLKECPDEMHKKLFEEAERGLRMFVTKQRMGKI
jgi:hypothetical protein